MQPWKVYIPVKQELRDFKIKLKKTNLKAWLKSSGHFLFSFFKS